MNYQHLLEKVQDYVLKYYSKHHAADLVYHNLQHTEDVVKAATKIANHYQLSDHDTFIVLAAAWFHDLGHLTTENEHEEEGVKLASAFFLSHDLIDKDIQLIAGCIRSTKMPQSPVTLLEQVVCDADLFKLGTEDFFKKDKLVLKEYNSLHHTELSKLEWRKKTIEFLEKQNYHTDYARALLNGTKAENLGKLKEKADKGTQKAINTNKEGTMDTLVPELETNKKPKKNKDTPDKGIETMFRISSSNHQRLSDMADKKAHIMITVNSIILSAIISLVLRRLNEYGYLIIPSFILLTISLLAMTFSILSTRPSIPNGTFSKADVDDRKVNLLFFGNFYKMKLEDFNDGMEKMMEDKKFLYGSLIKDLYAQGVVLGRKYHLLRIAYNIFMFGLIIAVVAFIVAFTFFSHNPAV